MNPEQRRRLANNLMAQQFDKPEQSPFGVPERLPYQGEIDFFKNSGVPGYAADDNHIVMSPFNQSPVGSRDAVRMNEGARVRMRDFGAPTFGLTQAQESTLGGLPYYSTASDADRKSTILARLLSGDPSGGTATPDQQFYINSLLRSYPHKQR